MTSRKATRMGALSRAPRRPHVVRDPGMHGRSLRGNREISRPAAAVRSGGPHREGRKAEADDARTGEVGQVHSTKEVREQSRRGGRGADGGKAPAQGERQVAKHTPDTAPAACVTGAALATRGTVWDAQSPNATMLSPERGARCGNSARRDLCGGRRAIAVPTATSRTCSASPCAPIYRL